MKSYPSISSDIQRGLSCYVFDKLDGSNIRVEWNPKKGFYKFGRRNGLLDGSNPILLRSPQIFLEKYSESLSLIFSKQKWKSVVSFFEFVGPSSFAGNHSEDERQDVVLFDVSPFGMEMLHPKDFVKLFVDSVDTAKLLHHGPVDFELIESVQNGTLPGMTLEGVVCKSGKETFKIKNRAWLERLKSACKTIEEFERLR